MPALATDGTKLAEMLVLHGKGLSQRDVAEELGVSQRAVCYALKRLRVPPNGYGTAASRRKRSRASRETVRLRRFREASSLVAGGPWWEAEWPLESRYYLAAQFGYLLFSALARRGAVAHAEPSLHLLSMGRSVLARAPEPRLRALAASLPAGTPLRVRDDRFALGAPTLRPCRPAATLASRCVTVKSRSIDHGDPDPAPLAARLRDDLGRMGMGRRVRLEMGERKVVRIRGAAIVGYGVLLWGLNPRESLLIQAAGLGGRRRFGCGVFVPC